MKPIRTIFIGSSAEGISSLEALIDHPQFEISAVITQPDKPFGRKKELLSTPIKQKALEMEIPIHTPKKNTNVYKDVRKRYNPQLAIVIAFGHFLPKTFLDSLQFKCINVHYSLLPLLRGAVPTQLAILNGHKKTGVTIQIMEESMDTGPILTQEEISIAGNETTPTLKEKLIPLGQKLLLNTLPDWIDEKITPQKQDHSKATYCYIDDISKQNAQIDWKKMDPEYVERMIRSFLPWPVAWTTLPDGKMLKIFEGSLQKTNLKGKPGDMIIQKDGLFFITNKPSTALHAITVQQEGKKQMAGTELAKGLR